MGRKSIALVLAMLVMSAVAGCAGSTPLPTVPSPTTSVVSSAAPSGFAAQPGFDGTSFYFVRTDTAVQMLSLHNGTVTRLRQIASPADDSCPANSVVVSPDGRWLAWITGVRSLGDLTGTLTVARMDGSSQHTVDNVLCSLTEADWTERGLEIVQPVGQASTYGTVDPTTGTVQPRTTPADAVPSPNNLFRVRRNGDVRNSFVVEKVDGTVVHTVRDYGNDSAAFRLCGYTLHGVSDDGRYVAIGGCSTDPSRVLGASYLYDTEAGRHVTLPVKSPDSITFAGTGVVLHDDGGGRLVYATVSGKLTVAAAEPAELPAEARFLVYVPA